MSLGTVPFDTLLITKLCRILKKSVSKRTVPADTPFDRSCLIIHNGHGQKNIYRNEIFMRLDKFLSAAGLGSRTDVKKIIKRGRILVNGKIAERPEQSIDENNDEVCLDGEKISFKANHYYELYKPDGVVSSTREGASTTVVYLLADENVKNLSPVGRLDKDTTGLLILTDDGALIHNLLSPKKHVEKEYVVTLRDEISDDDLKRLENGLDIGDDKPTLPAKTIRTGEKEIHLILHEGRFHQVKRMLKAVGNEVTALKRIRMGGLVLDESLQPGEYRELTEEEIGLLRS